MVESIRSSNSCRPLNKDGNALESLDYLKNALTEYRPVEAQIVSAVTQLSERERTLLSSEDAMVRGMVMGNLYESLAYEAIIDIATKSELIKSIVRKGSDVSKSHRTRIGRFGQDGLFYDPNGKTIIRGNGIDLREIDYILFDKNDRLLFCEAKLGGNYLKEFDYEIQYKRRLLEELFEKPGANNFAIMWGSGGVFSIE